MNKLAVETQREYYPMTFYPEGLNATIRQPQDDRIEAQTIPLSKAIPIAFNKTHYYREIKFKQFLFGQFSITTGIALILSIMFGNYISTLMLSLTNILFITGFFSLQRYKDSLKLEFIYINKKASERDYKLLPIKTQVNEISPTNLLLNSLGSRERIYDFKIDRSANKGLSEAYFLSFLSKWYVYPWRILEHCQFEYNHYTPTADFILIYDDLKLGIDIEIDEPYTLKESMPIHLAEDSKYIYRDKFFLSLGYIVIRFAEYQVAKYPDYCCLHIARVVNQFLDREMKINMPNSTNITSLESKVWRVKAWTRKESETMARRRIRDEYLEPVKAFNSGM